MTDRRYWIWFSSMTDISLNSKANLLEFFGSPENAFNSTRGTISGIEGISAHDAEIMEQRDMERVERIIGLCEKNGERIITIDSPLYPSSLKEIYAPPYVIYVKGELPDFAEHPGVSVIGTRRASAYGMKMGRNIAYELIKCGVTVITGLAAGIETESAKAALLAGGPVLAVIGTPIEKATGELLSEIEQKGAVVSEYPPETVTRRHFFRYKNRICAGCSMGVLAVEAPEQSGTRLFIAEALEQGKEIFAVPGNADSENSRGILKFIRDGAIPVAHGWEIAEILNESGYVSLNCESREIYPDNSAVAKPDKVSSKTSNAKNKPENKKIIDNEKVGCYIDISELTEPQKLIVNTLSISSAGVDELVELCDMPSAAILAELTMLQIDGIVVKEAGGTFKLAGNEDM